MDTVGSRLKTLRNGMGKSQKQMAEMVGVTQSTINRYENNESEPVYRVLLWYADTFDVSLDYIFCRTDNPQSKYFSQNPDIEKNSTEWQEFVESCFEPGSALNDRLKQTMLQMLQDGGKGK